MTDMNDAIIATLHDRFGVDTADVTPATTFEDLGIDSLIVVELALILRKTLRVQLDDDDFYPELTIADAAALLDTKAGLAA